MAKRDGKGGNAAIIMDEAIQQCPFLPRLILTVADDNQRAGQDFYMVRVSACGFSAAFYIAIERLAICQIAVGTEHHFCGFSR